MRAAKITRGDRMTKWSDPGGFIPHGFCLSWDPDLIVAMVLSNALIAIAYMVITVALLLKAVERTTAIPRWMYWTYATFIFSCGISHVLDDVTLWFPVYRLQAAVLAVTGMLSLFAAVVPVSIWLTHGVGRRRP